MFVAGRLVVLPMHVSLGKALARLVVATTLQSKEVLCGCAKKHLISHFPTARGLWHSLQNDVGLAPVTSVVAHRASAGFEMESL